MVKKEVRVIKTTTWYSNHDPEKTVGMIFENFGKCPKCGSKSKEDLGILGEAWQEYKCLMCGAEWTEPTKELQQELSR